MPTEGLRFSLRGLHDAIRGSHIALRDRDLSIRQSRVSTRESSVAIRGSERSSHIRRSRPAARRLRREVGCASVVKDRARADPTRGRSLFYGSGGPTVGNPCG